MTPAELRDRASIARHGGHLYTVRFAERAEKRERLGTSIGLASTRDVDRWTVEDAEALADDARRFVWITGRGLTGPATVYEWTLKDAWQYGRPTCLPEAAVEWPIYVRAIVATSDAAREQMAGLQRALEAARKAAAR